MYDWANSAFSTTVVAVVLPIFFKEVATANLHETEQYLAISIWGYTTSIAMLFVAVIALILGPVSDYKSSKKKFLGFFIVLGIFSTSFLGFTGTGNWLAVSALFILGNIGFAGSEIFYNSLLPHIAPPDKIDRISTRGYAFGYAGGGLLLLINICMIWFLPKSTISPAHQNVPVIAMQLSFLSVSVWWAVFSIPILKHVPEPGNYKTHLNKENLLKIAVRRLSKTFKEIKKYRQLLIFIIAFWLYNDGIGTIIKMAVIYGNEIGISILDLVGALLLVQIIGIPMSFIFGRLAEKISAKKAILAGLAVYILISIFAFFMSEAIHFWGLAFMVGLVQGGTQGLSRSLYASMIPKNKSAEFFSFYNISGKFAGVIGPAVFAITSQLTKSSRFGIISLIFFFVTGGIILMQLKENK